MSRRPPLTLTQHAQIQHRGGWGAVRVTIRGLRPVVAEGVEYRDPHGHGYCRDVETGEPVYHYPLPAPVCPAPTMEGSC